MKRRCTALTVIALLTAPSASGGAQVPRIRPIGPLLRMSAPGLVGSVSAVRELPGGRLIVNDIARRRVVLFDSSLATILVIADSSSGTGAAFGARVGGIISYRGDSTLFADPASMSMLVIDGEGAIARVMAVPRPREATYLVGGPFGTPGFDPKGRLISRGAARGVAQAPGGDPFVLPAQPDSAPVIRIDLATRKVDTIGQFKVSKADIRFARNEAGVLSVVTTIDPMQTVDDWALLPDGTVAIVRGRDYHVDWIGPDGVRKSTPKVPFQWQRMTDADRRAVLDSAAAAMEKELAAFRLQVSGRGAGALGERRPVVPGAPTAPPPRNQAASASAEPTIRLVQASELPEFRPVLVPGSVRADPEGRLWIRTSDVRDGAPVFDIVDRRGALVDRVQLPKGRILAGFGVGGILYMGVLDGSGARVEKARVNE